MAKRFDPKAKARKQKILAAGLGVVLLAVLAFQAPTILGLFKGSSSTASSEPAATPTPAPAAPAAPASGGAPAPTPTAAPAGELIDSDIAPEPAQGQLVSFDRFESKDPFAQQIGKGASGTTSGGGAGAEPAVPPKDNGLAPVDPVPTPVEETPAPTASVTRTARISVNGVSEDVAVAATFPESDPIFKLVSLKGATAKVGIVDGTYATGAPTITLRKGGKPVTLMNTADGTTYVLRLLDVG
jgi:hypothetical protein